MTILPPHIKERFFQTLNGKIALVDFERWLYADEELEDLLQPDDYLAFISLNFNKSGAKYEVWNLIAKHTHPGEYETYKIVELLDLAKNKTDRLPYYLMDFYDLYCKGYGFLQKLGFDYGLSVVVPNLEETAADTWEELTKEQQNRLLHSFSPGLEQEIERVTMWLSTGKVILTGEKDDMRQFEYFDFRNEEDRKK
jgi:hypothetical protein